MNHRCLSLVVLLPLMLCVTGCQASRKVGQAAAAVPLVIVDGIINGLFDSDETIFERDHRERRDRPWKQYWRDHPSENPAMHEAFKDDY